MRDLKRKRPVILVIEDDPGDQELIRRALEHEPADIDLRIVNDGEQAINYLFRRDRFAARMLSPRPDLILLDLNLPRLDGKQVLAKIRSSEQLRSIPVVVLTTSTHEEDITRSYELGCNSFIPKPVEIDQLIQVCIELRSYWFQLVRTPHSRSIKV